MDESASEGEKRRRPRQSLMMQAALRLPGKADAIEVRVRNLSTCGALVACRACPDVGERVTIDVRGIGAIPGKVSRATASTVAILFDEPVDTAAALPAAAPRASKVQLYHHVANPRRPALTIK